VHDVLDLVDDVGQSGGHRLGLDDPI